MKRLPGVCLAGLSLAASTTLALAARKQGIEEPRLRPGIRVQMAVTENAVAMPGADRVDALVVAVTADGAAYLGIEPVSTAALMEKVRDALSRGTQKKVYLKADARTGFGRVMQVLAALRDAGASQPGLLTTQRLSAEQQRPVPPMGLEVGLSAAGADIVTVELRNSGQREPVVVVDGTRTPWANLAAVLRQQFRARGTRVALVGSEASLAFGEVVKVADLCRAAGGRVDLAVPGK